MTSLNKTQEKYLAAIEPYLADLQVFVSTHIKGSSTLTAAAVHEKFTASHECDLDSKLFINGFRVAVGTGRITGIEGAKRAGYREKGAKAVSNTKTTANKTLDDIAPYLEDIQAFIDLHFDNDEVRMTAAVIYQKFSTDNECSLDEKEFVNAFRLALREGKLTGLESAYRFGYKKAGAQGSSPRASSFNDDASTGQGEVVIDDRRRLIALDKYNWAFQTRKDSGRWNTESYYSNAFQALRGLARKLMDDELKHMPTFPLDQLEQKFTEAENNLMKLLHEATGGNNGRNEASSTSS
jgi:hypothetical protein